MSRHTGWEPPTRYLEERARKLGIDLYNPHLSSQEARKVIRKAELALADKEYKKMLEEGYEAGQEYYDSTWRTTVTVVKVGINTATCKAGLVISDGIRKRWIKPHRVGPASKK